MHVSVPHALDIYKGNKTKQNTDLPLFTKIKINDKPKCNAHNSITQPDVGLMPAISAA